MNVFVVFCLNLSYASNIVRQKSALKYVVLICIVTGHLQKILSHDHPPEYSFDFYAAYINILLGVFYPVCRDLKELRHLVRDLLGIFLNKCASCRFAVGFYKLSCKHLTDGCVIS